MSSDIMKQKETQERMGKEQRHQIEKSKTEMKVKFVTQKPIGNLARPFLSSFPFNNEGIVN